MNRAEFMQALDSRLVNISAQDKEEALKFFDELFEDALEEGKSEQEIVASLDTPDEIAKKVRAEAKFVQTQQQPGVRSWTGALVIVLGALSAPITVPLAIALMAIIFSLVVVVFSVLLSLFAVPVSLFAAGIGVVVAGILFIGTQGFWIGALVAGIGFMLIGLSLLLFALMTLLSKQVFKWTSLFFQWAYRTLTKKGGKLI